MTSDEEVSGVMAGDGYYDRHSATQQGAAVIGLDLLRTAIAESDRGAMESPKIADLGCAQGHNSLAPMKAAIGAVRRRTTADIDIVHTDLPGNDWTSLFEVIEHDPASYMVGHKNDVHPSVIGRSFYKELFAPATLTAAWSSSSLHWLSASPGPVADNFFVQSSTDHVAIERYRSRSVTDWTDFLARRSVELAPTASVVFVDVLMGDARGGVAGTMGSEALFDTLEQALRAARSAGTITAEEYAAMVYPTWFRSLDEVRAPFAPAFTGPGGETLQLVTLEPTTLADPFLAAYDTSGDAGAYARQQAGFLRGFLEPSFGTALPRRTAPQRTAILDAVFADAERRIAADPRAVSPTYKLAAGRIRRAA
ncbi:hypothetical protein [Glaciibacter superstes]|uniref:hypothetical protein n=1 Tax=Glaciibacter superstes TaxID=501023 RepID=UPI0012FAF4BD|nr:hypothetical protein [Glaciibacter superstes]